MENKNKHDSEQLTLTKYCFQKLIAAILNTFKHKHSITTINDSQLFGFGNYNLESPSLQKDFQQLTKGYINGKYLYNKNREQKQGKPIIKISKEYKHVFFTYLNYTGIEEFLESEITDPLEHERQKALITTNYSNEDYHYCCYYYGEDRTMTKGKLTIFNNWHTIELQFVYFDDKSHKYEYTFYGSIKISEDFIHITTKFIVNNSKKEGANFIFFVGKSNPKERPYLIGTYSGFDKYNRAIAGKIILKKFEGKKEMEAEYATKLVDPLITQELRRERIIVESQVPTRAAKISEKSPYASLFSKLSGNYTFIFYNSQQEKIETLALLIDARSYNIMSANNDLIIENDHVKLMYKGQSIHLDFEILGISFLQKVSMYIKSYDLFHPDNEITGLYSGLDNNNNPVCGVVKIAFVKQK